MRVVVDYDLLRFEPPSAWGSCPRCSKCAMTTSSTSSTIIPGRSIGRSSWNACGRARRRRSRSRRSDPTGQGQDRARPPRATSTSGAPGRPFTTGVSPGAPGGTFILRIEDTDESATGEPVRGHHRGRSAGSRSTGTRARTGSQSGPPCMQTPSTGCGTPATCTPATARGKRCSSARRRTPSPATTATADTGASKRAGEGAALRNARRRRHRGEGRHPGRRRVRQPHDRGDFVVARSNGDALFVLAVVVDDRDMAISHVNPG